MANTKAAARAVYAVIRDLRNPFGKSWDELTEDEQQGVASAGARRVGSRIRHPGPRAMTGIISRITRFGFRFGPVRVDRGWSDKAGVGIFLHTGKQVLHIRVTPSGLIRVGEIEKDWSRLDDDA